MSERNINIDDLFKDALKDFKVESPLRSKTAKKESFVKKNAKWLLFGSAALIVVSASYLFVFTQHEKTHVVPKVQQKEVVVPLLAVPAEKEIIRDTVVKVVEVPKTIVVEAPQEQAKAQPNVNIPVYQESTGEKSMIITTRSSYSETYEVDEKGNKIKVLSTQKTQRSDTTLVK